MIRDPLERAMSDYYYAHTYSNHRFKDEIRSGELHHRGIFGQTREYGLSGEQTVMIAGLSDHGQYVDRAIDTARASYVSVGTTERFG